MELVIYGVILGARRLTNTQSGNPRYRTFLDNGVAMMTEGDVTIYSVEDLIGKRVELRCRNGRVYQVNLVETTEPDQPTQ